MQGEIIVNRIIADANLKAQESTDNARQRAKSIMEEAEAFNEKKNQEVKDETAVRGKEISDRYATLARIEGNKIILNKKQEIIKDLKNKALDSLLALSNDKKLELVEKMLKNNASKGETLKVNIEGVSLDDVKKLKVVKDLELKVEKNNDKNAIGLILSSASMDKNLLFYQLIDMAYDENEEKINGILF